MVCLPLVNDVQAVEDQLFEEKKSDGSDPGYAPHSLPSLTKSTSVPHSSIESLTLDNAQASASLSGASSSESLPPVAPPIPESHHKRAAPSSSSEACHAKRQRESLRHATRHANKKGMPHMSGTGAAAISRFFTSTMDEPLQMGLQFSLVILQQPVRARMIGFSEKDRY